MFEHETKMKRVPNVLRESLIGALEAFVFLFSVLVLFMMVSGVPWKFGFLEVSRIAGYQWFLDILVLILLVTCVSLVSFLVLKILKRKTFRAFFATSLVMSFLILSSLILVFVPRISKACEKVDAFVAKNADLELQDYVASISSFLSENIRSSYNKPEASCEIDEYIYGTLLDSYILGAWGATRADLIVYQGWGSCGQTAIVTEELLLDAKYEARRAHFKGIDHEWAEVKSGGKWLMVDPGYIGNLVPIGNLRTIKPQFQQASGVEVQYRNGTIIDESIEHGY